MNDRKIGLALGGGAARGWAHIGVIKALESAGIVPDVIAGTSIGAVVGGCYAAGEFEAIEAFARTMTPRRMFGFFDLNLAGSGLINGQRLSDALEHQLDDLRIEDLEKPFTAIATEIGTGHEVWLSRGRMVDAIRASYAIPGIFKPVRIQDRWLFDGALVNPIPVSVCRALGARHVIAVNLNADLFTLGTVLSHFEGADAAMEEGNVAPVSDEPDGGENGETEKGARALIQRQMFGFRKRSTDDVPSISTIMVDAFNIVHDRIARSRLAGDPPDVLINPRLGQIGLFDFHRADELIRIGELTALRTLAALRHDAETIDDLELTPDADAVRAGAAAFQEATGSSR
ncbi:MAG: patatin-like phospholipase family protein [Pseudomonadota bacterium]